MPCMSYDDRPDYNDREWKAKTDKLARIACKAMTALQELGKEDFLLLKDDEVREWWVQHQAADRLARAAREKKEREAHMRQEALAKLSDEEKRLLGLSNKKKTVAK